MAPLIALAPILAGSLGAGMGGGLGAGLAVGTALGVGVTGGATAATIGAGLGAGIAALAPTLAIAGISTGVMAATGMFDAPEIPEPPSLGNSINARQARQRQLERAMEWSKTSTRRVDERTSSVVGLSTPLIVGTAAGMPQIA